MIFMKFYFFRENRIRICPKLKTPTKPMLFYSFFHHFSQKPAFSLKSGFGLKNLKYHENGLFSPISCFLLNLGHFSDSWKHSLLCIYEELRFKAEIQRFRELFRVLQQNALFGSKTGFLVKFSSWSEKSPPGL